MAKSMSVNQGIKDKENIKQKNFRRILRRVDLIWATLAVIGLMIGALNQYNSIIVGLVAICEGVLGILLFISHVRLFKMGYIPTTRLLDVLLETGSVSFNDKNIFVRYEEEFESARLGHKIILVIILFFSVIFIIIGILKLLSIIWIIHIIINLNIKRQPCQKAGLLMFNF